MSPNGLAYGRSPAANHMSTSHSLTVQHIVVSRMLIMLSGSQSTPPRHECFGGGVLCALLRAPAVRAALPASRAVHAEPAVSKATGLVRCGDGVQRRLLGASGQSSLPLLCPSILP